MGAATRKVFLAAASFLSALGGAIHAAAFRKALNAISVSNLPHFYAASSEGLWLADSATLIILAVIFALLAFRPRMGTRPLLMLIALIPASTAVMLFVFLGTFFAGYLLLIIAILTFLAGLGFRQQKPE